MQVTEYLERSSEPLFSIEVTPPLKTKSINQIFKVIDRLLPYNPAFVNVTYHRETVSEQMIDNKLKTVTYQKHASIVGVCGAVRYKYDIEVVPHILCGGFDKFETEDALFDLCFLGIDNVLALRGDKPKDDKKFVNDKSAFPHAIGLVEHIREMNDHHYIHQLSPKVSPAFCIGVAGYPEKHSEASSLETDINWLKKKVDAGASYIVTQMFYDFDKFVEWEQKCRLAGITVPIFPGLRPITKTKQVRRYEETFNVSIPEDFKKRMLSIHDKQKAFECGVDFMSDLCRKLLDYGVPGLHFFVFGNAKDVEEIAKRVF